MSKSMNESVKPDSSSVSLDARYETDAPVWRDTVQDAARAWATYEYPLAKRSEFEAGTLLASRNLLFKQNRDGSGYVQHKEDVCAVRTIDGAFLFNTTCEPGDHSIHCRWQMSHYLYETEGVRYEEVPFAFVEELVATETDLEPMKFIEGIVEVTQNHQQGPWRGGNESPGVLLAHASGHRVYVGRDTSAHRDNRLFGFVVPPREEVPDAESAIDLLRPDTVATAEDAGADVIRQGEWWLLPDETGPAGTIQNPGVGERPFGASPLGNHIPRDWATGCTDAEFLARVEDAFVEMDVEPPATPQEAVEVVKEHAADPLFQLTFHDLRSLADGIFVRGSLRHQHNEHYLETVDGWHRAVTHDRQVYTADAEYQANLD